jgi:hypothetical protein
MFIYKDNPKNKDQKRIYEHPLDKSEVRFMKYAGKLFVNVYDYFSPFHNSEEMFNNIKKTLPIKWKNNLKKVWMSTDDFNSVQNAVRKNITSKKEK